MRHDLNLVFKQIDELDPPAEMAGAIMGRIAKEKNRLFRAKLWVTRLGSIGSLFILSYTFWVFGHALADSEFWRIASLISSDMNAVLSNWKEFGYSLLETLPIFDLLAILLPLFTLFLFFNFYLNLSNKNHAPHQKIKTV